MLPQYRTALVKILGQPKNIGILGYGLEGRSSHHILRELYPDTKITVLDQQDVEQTGHQLDKYRTGKDYRSYLNECDILLRSPGLKLEPTGYSGIVTSQIDLFTQLCRERIIGVTGTKGKSTTTTLIHHLLSQKYETALVGNIGTPALESLSQEFDYYVCEYSCHQLSDITTSPKYAILLNLYPEHLDYYQTVEEYYATKRNIFNYQRTGDKVYSIEGLVPRSMVISKDRELDINDQNISINGSMCYINGIKIDFSGQLTGVHNEVNQLFAVVIAVELGMCADEVKRGLSIFLGLPHRLETVYENEKLRYVNDSISTIPQSTLAAIASYQDLNMVLIGGYDRGIDYTPLIEQINDGISYRIILFSQVGKRISKAITSDFILVETFAAAVDHVLKKDPSAGTILMSPGASSYDEFKSFTHRGAYFKNRIVDHYKK